MFRCPYCGEEAFLLTTKLGINTKLAVAPCCPNCKKVVFRNFIIGGHFLYSVILGLAALCAGFGIFISNKIGFNAGMLLFPLLLVVFYLIYNYYFCYFDRVGKTGNEQKLNLELNEKHKVWPNIRKGEIYKIAPVEIKDLTGNDCSIIAMMESNNKGKLQFRIITKPQNEKFVLKGEFVIYSGDIGYAATLI